MFPVRRRESIRIAIIAILVIKGSAVKVSLLEELSDEDLEAH